MSDLLNNYATIVDAIEKSRVSQNIGQPVMLLAVSKHKPAAMIAELANAGHRHFGENYLQETLEKQRELLELSVPDDIVWHYIGHIQRNKTKAIATYFSWVHTVSREMIAKRLSDQRSENLPALNVCIQVNIDEEASKSGCLPQETFALAQRIHQYERIALRGLMIIPSKSSDDAFARTKALFDEIGAVLDSPHWDTLSMGMSADFHEAIAEGASIVRVGSAIFGARD